MLKILVVEDDRDLNRSVCALLNRNGYEAIGCENANDAYNRILSLLAEHIVHLGDMNSSLGGIMEKDITEALLRRCPESLLNDMSFH